MKNNDLTHFFEDRTKLKIPPENKLSLENLTIFYLVWVNIRPDLSLFALQIKPSFIFENLDFQTCIDLHANVLTMFLYSKNCLIAINDHKCQIPSDWFLILFLLERVVHHLPLMTYGLKLSLEAWILRKIIQWFEIQWVAATFQQLKFFL